MKERLEKSNKLVEESKIANEYWNSIPVMNKKEAIDYLKEAEKVYNPEWLH